MLDAETKRRIDCGRDILVGNQRNHNAHLIHRMEAKVKAAIDRVWGQA